MCGCAALARPVGDGSWARGQPQATSRRPGSCDTRRAGTMKRIAPVIALLCLSGCASYHVQRGAAIGAISGAALGAATGEIISDPGVLGSRNSGRRGDTALPQGQTILV